MSFMIVETNRGTIGVKIDDGKNEVYLVTPKASIYKRPYRKPDLKKVAKALHL